MRISTKPKWKLKLKIRPYAALKWQYCSIVKWKDSFGKPMVYGTPGLSVQIAWLEISYKRGSFNEWERYLWTEWYLDGWEEE